MARVEPGHLVVHVPASGEGVEVVVHLSDRAAGVVLPGQDEDRHAHRVDVGQRRRDAVGLGFVLRRAAEQGAVERAQLLHLVGVRGEVVGHGHPGEPRGPPLGLGPDGEQREVSTPRPALHHTPGGVDEAVGHARVEHRGHVLEFGRARPPLYRVAPRRAVARGAAVVHLHHDEPGLDPRRTHGAEPVLVGGVRTAVQAEHGALRAVHPRRPCDQRVHPPAGPVHPQVGDRHRGGRALAGRGEQHAVGAVRMQGADRGGLRGRGAGVLHRAVRTGVGRSDAARRHGELGELLAPQVVAVQPGAGGVGVPDEQVVAVGCEVGEHLTGQVEADLPLLVAQHVPDQQLLTAVALVQQEQPSVACDRREREGLEPPALPVVQLGDGVTVGDAQDAHGGMAGVAVLGVADREEGLVLRQRADARVLDVAVDHRRRTLARPQPDPGAGVGGGAHGGDGASDLEARRVAVLDARDGELGDRAVGQTGEGLGDPVAELVAVGVGEPPHPLTVGRQRGGVGAAAPVGDLAVDVGGAVPDVHLGRPAQVRRVDTAVGGVAGPPRTRHPGGGEPRAPALLTLVVEESIRYGSGGVGGHAD